MLPISLAMLAKFFHHQDVNHVMLHAKHVFQLVFQLSKTPVRLAILPAPIKVAYASARIMKTQGLTFMNAVIKTKQF